MGQIDEQYILPKRITRMKMIKNPREVNVMASINSTAEGMN